jgi:hypothetical protein
VAKKELIVEGYIIIDGEERPWESFTPEEQKEIGLELNDRALRAAGYVPVNELNNITA